MASASHESSGSRELPDERKIEMTLDLWMNPDNFRDEHDAVDEDLMYREALNYAAEAAEQDEFDMAITRVSEVSEQPSESEEREAGTCPICESTARKMRDEPLFLCDGCARRLNRDELCDS